MGAGANTRYAADADVRLADGPTPPVAGSGRWLSNTTASLRFLQSMRLSLPSCPYTPCVKGVGVGLRPFVTAPATPCEHVYCFHNERHPSTPGYPASSRSNTLSPHLGGRLKLNYSRPQIAQATLHVPVSAIALPLNHPEHCVSTSPYALLRRAATVRDAQERHLLCMTLKTGPECVPASRIASKVLPKTPPRRNRWVSCCDRAKTSRLFQPALSRKTPAVSIAGKSHYVLCTNTRCD